MSTEKKFRLKPQEKELLERPYYAEVLQTVVFASANGGKRHADMLAYDVKAFGVTLTRNQVAGRLGALVKAGLVQTFQDWVNGNHIGNNYDPTLRGVEVAEYMFDFGEDVISSARSAVNGLNPLRNAHMEVRGLGL